MKVTIVRVIGTLFAIVLAPLLLWLANEPIPMQRSHDLVWLLVVMFSFGVFIWFGPWNRE